MLEIRLFGKFELKKGAKTLELPSRKAQSLLAYLLLNQGVYHRREKIAGLLWPDSEETKARNQLRYALWQLRKVFGDQYFESDKISIAINPQADFWVDVSQIDIENPQSISIEEIQKVLSVYKGELLPGFYEDWILLERDRFQALYDDRVQLLLERLAEDGRWREVLKWSENWIALGGSPEPAFRMLIVTHAQLGDISSAAKAYQRCTNILKEQLGVEPSEETQKIYQIVTSGEKFELPTPFEMGAVSSVREESLKIPSFLDTKGALTGDHPSLFVAREDELDKLDRYLDKAIVGEGCILFVKGDAGQGKTTLLHEFSRRSLRKNEQLVEVYGGGEAHTGVGDPHLVFRDILELLVGDIENKWTRGLLSREGALRLWNLFPEAVEALTWSGPDLIGSFISTESILARSELYAPDGREWLELLSLKTPTRQSNLTPINIQHSDVQSALFEQYTKVLQKISQGQPLLIVLDDLQWADLGSISLLFHLGRRTSGHRIMVLGAYRSDEIAQGRDGNPHPLVQVLMEFRRIYGDIEIDLDQKGKENGYQFVSTLIDSEPNRLGVDFRKALFQHTGGNPLFTIELLRQLQEQGDLKKDDQDYWVEGPDLGWETLPARVDAVIAGRVNRLEDPLREILHVGSVEGEEFSAEVIARVSAMDDAEIVHRLSHELNQRYLLVEARGTQRIGSQRLSRYRFRHHLFYKYVYNSLDVVELSYLHEKVGKILESIYGDRRGEIAVRLARHFEIAGLDDKALDYLHLAGERAKRQSANEEAIVHFNKGLTILKNMPQSYQRNQKELAFQISKSAPLVATLGYTAPEVELTYERARELCEQVDDTSQLVTALWGLWSFYLVRGKYSIALETAEQIKETARTSDHPNLSLVVPWTLGITLAHMGEFKTAKEHLDIAIDHYNKQEHRYLTYLYGQNPGVTCLIYSSFVLWYLGFPDQALDRSKSALKLAEEISHPYSLSFVHCMLAIFHGLRKEIEEVQHHASQAVTLSKETGFPFLLGIGFIMRGWARMQAGKTSKTIAHINGGITTMQSIGADLGRPLFLFFLAQAYQFNGQTQEGINTINVAIETAIKNEEHLNLPDLYRLKGELIEFQGVKETEIESCYLQAIELARQQNAKLMEIQALMSLLKFREPNTHVNEIRNQLAEVYAWFSEGFETFVLREARNLLGTGKSTENKIKS
jgi:DNA-binding SARP family transcriptional activator/predicted ATPase